MSDRIITKSVVEIKATASLSKEIAKELVNNGPELDLKEIIDEHKYPGRNDRKRGT